MNAALKPIPDGFMRNGQGHLVPTEQVKELDKLRNDLVLDIIAKVQVIQKQLRECKDAIQAEVQAFLDLSAREYGTQYGGAKGNVTLSSYDGRYRIIRAVAEHLAFDERLQVAKQLIDECIHEWTASSSSEVQALVEHAFQVDKTGKISTGRVLSLRSLNIDHPKWQEAMSAIMDSIQVTGSKSYIRFYERFDDESGYVQIPLDIAAL